MPRVAKDFFRSARLHDLPGVHDGHTVRGLRRHPKIVCHQNRGHPQLPLKIT